MSRLLAWARRKQDAQGALREALEAPLPSGAPDLPFEVDLGAWSATVRHAVSLAVILSVLVTFRILGELAINLPALLLVMGVVLFALASLPELAALNRSLRISGEGIRLEKVLRTYTVPWWEVQGIEAKSDISSFRVLSPDRDVTCDCRNLTLEKRKEIVIAIRARLPAGLEIAEWPKQGQLPALARSVLLSGAAFGLFFAASLLVALGPGGHVLGIRCGVSSQYLQTLFGLPAERGCVILRVSGAAEDAGLRQGDLIVVMNDIPITSGSQFTITFERSERRDFSFTVLRPGRAEPIDFHVSLGAPGGPFEEDPDDPFFYYLLARGDAERAHIEEDIADYTRAIELAPDFDLAHLYRGGLYEEIGDYRSALRDYRKAIQLSPRLGEAYSILAYFLNPDDIPEAMANIEEAIRLNECESGFLRYNVDCAVAYSLLARLEGYSDVGVTVRVANDAVRFYPDLPDPYFELASANEGLGNLEEASEYAERYLQLADGWPYGPPDRAREDYAKEILRESTER